MGDSGTISLGAQKAGNYDKVSKVAVRALKQTAFKGPNSKIGPRTVVLDTDFTWRITNWYGLELGPNGDAKSPPVKIDDMQYTIAVYPRGAGAARETHISVFLHVAPANPNQIEWKVPCTFALLLWNPKKPAAHRALEIKDFEFSFVGELNWGCAKLCDLASANSLITENGECNVTIFLRVFDNDKF